MSNLVPDGWSITTLGQVSEFIMGQAPLGSACNKNGIGTPFVKAGEFAAKYPVIREWTTSPLKFAKQGDVLMCVVGATCGKLNLAIDCSIGRSVAAIRPSVKLNSMYLYNFLLPLVEVLRHGSAGSAQGVITKDNLDTIEMVLPALPEQQKIASILTAVDEVIESTTAQINKLKDLKTGMMQELLTKGIGHTEFKDSPVGLIPKGWKFKSVGDICKVTSGGTPDRMNMEFWNGNIPWIKTGEINYTTIYSAEEYITELGLKNSSTKLIPAGSVLMAMYGQGITRGKVAMLEIDACLNQACLAMLPNHELDKYFLFYFFSKEYENLRLLVQEGTQKNLNAGIVKEILLPLPPLYEQVKICERLQAIDIFIESKQSKLNIVENLKKSLMQDLLGGKVRVRVL